jgi:neutral ceramidase
LPVQNSFECITYGINCYKNYPKMKKSIFLSIIFFLLILTFNKVNASADLQKESSGWKAGVARVTITPEKSMWLAGYGARNRPSEGTEADLFSKALVLEDAGGKKAVLITNDLVKVPKNISDRIRDRIGAKYGLTRSQIILNCSHTHSGPVLYNSSANQYNLENEQLGRVKEYSVKYENQIVDLVGRAIGSMVPVRIYVQNGITRFQVNRRNNNEPALDPLTELKGPNDYAVPVIKIEKPTGELMAVAFGYACHATVTDQYKWSGDWPGFAQTELEKSHPGAVALFFQGAGADQNPLPRRTIALARQYGREMAAAVERVLEEEMKPVSPKISAAYSEIALPYTDLPSKEELAKIAAESSSYPAWHKKWASGMLEKLAKGDKIPAAYPSYPIQVWKLGDQPIMALGGELVVEYAIRLKQTYGQNIFVMGYSNDIMSYIPSPTILREGGYEGIRSQLSSGLPGTYKPEIQEIILSGLAHLAQQAGVMPAPNSK